MEGVAQRICDASDCQLPVASLASLVLGDRAQYRPGLAEDALLLAIGERAGCFDVEEGLHSRLGLLRMLAARPA